ncbi:MAG: hypothetical protein ACRC7G_14025 [Beijerinckiaceae bacterium]
MKLRVSLFASLLLGLAALSSPAVAQTPAVFSALRIDVSSLPAGAVFARRQLESCLQKYVTDAFAGRIVPRSGAAALVVRPLFLDLSTNASSQSGGGGSDNDWSPDYLQGEAVTGGKRVPLLVSGGGGGSSAVYPEADVARRTDELCRSFAYWLARKI